MAASKAQGRNFGWFLLGTAVLCAGVALIGTVAGKLLLLAGTGILLASMAGFLRIKPLEGESPLKPGPEAMKWIGAAVAVLGWAVTLGGLHLVDGNGGRIVVALLGIATSLFGILYVLPVAFNKTAFWKMPASREGLTAVASKATVEPHLAATPGVMGSTR